MEVTITILSGPVAESEYRFREFPIAIGRRLDNHIAISDPAVSRYHCQIVDVGGAPRIVDLGSQNGIRVNERISLQEALNDGDVIAVGAARFRIETSASTEPRGKAKGEPTKADNQISGMDTVSVAPYESTYLQSTPLRGAGRSERDLWTLLSICRAVGERTTPEEAQIQLIDQLFEAIPAERAAIVLCEEPGAPPISIMTRSRLRGADSFEISRGVLRQVLQEGRAFLRTRIQDEQDGAPRTMVVDQVQAALAVPLMAGGRIIGVLYLDTRRHDALLDRAHLDLATAAAATAAASIESLRRQDLLQARARLVEAQSRDAADLVLLGDSETAESLQDEARRRAREDAPLIIWGPAGSEGVRLARWIHLNSSREGGPFVQVRCDARDHESLNRELFGEDQAGPGIRQLPLFEAAYGGTVLIHGLQGMSRECEERLVRLMRSGTLERRAGAEEAPVNIRLILLWEGECDRAVLDRHLGTELLDMLGPPLEIPALDDRPSDIAAIAEGIAKAAAREAGRTAVVLSSSVATVLKRFSWPENLTQLRGAIERAEAQRMGGTIELDDLPEEILESGRAKISGYHERVYQSRRRILIDALERTGGNFSEAAEMLEINRTYLHRLIRTLEMKDEVADRFSE